MLEWIEHHPGLATWVQAVGSLIGICVAIYVPYRLATKSQRAAEQDKVILERSVIVYLREHYSELNAQITRRIGDIENASDQVILAGTDKTGKRVELTIQPSERLQQSLIELTPRLTGKTSRFLQDLALAVLTYNEEVRRWPPASPAERRARLRAAAEVCLARDQLLRDRLHIHD